MTIDPRTERMLKWFRPDHFWPGHLQDVAAKFATLAHSLVDILEPGPERTAALRKLLEAKDCAVRAHLFPGG